MSKKKTLPQNLQKLKEALETGNNLVDHFLLCGVDPSIYQDEDLYDLSNENYLENLEKKISEPKIISKFPEFDNNNDSIDEGILSYCFPKGFKPIKSEFKMKERNIFSIILDNNLFSSEYPQKYLTCCLFYEKISLYKKLQEEIEKKQLEEEMGMEESSYRDDSIIRDSFAPVKNSEKNILSHIKPPRLPTLHLPTNNNDDRLTKSNMESYKSGNRTSRTSKAQNSSPFFKLKYYYIPKCICIVSIHPYIKFFQKFLIEIYEKIFDQNAKPFNIPLEKYIASLIIEVPHPPRGLYTIEYTLIDYKYTLLNTENNKILIYPFDFKKIHNNIKLNIILETIKHILLGSKILFFSIKTNYLTEVILAFLYLIFPFKYPFQVTSFLNKENYRILESISPFIIGINEQYNKKFFEENDISLEGMNILVVDLDNNESDLLSDELFPNFPSKPLSNLEKEIQNFDIKLKNKEKEKEGADGDNNEKKENSNEEYQNIFFNFFCEILKNYEEYLNMNYFKNRDNEVMTSIETLFLCEKFINSHNANDVEFYQKFVLDSQLFADFIYKRMIPKNNQELVDISLVNEKASKQSKLKFLLNEYIDISKYKGYKRNNIYRVLGARELSKEEKISINKNIMDLYDNGNLIIKEKIKDNENEKNEGNQKINNKDNNYKILFKYYIFPKLNFKIYCNNDNVNEYCPPPDFSEEIEAINTDLVSKTSLGKNINRRLEMKNYIYLTWLEVWAYSFNYIDINEKHYRFDQMLDILNKVLHHEINIYNLIFDVLNKQREDEMILKLYQKLLQLKINPSTFIYDIISHILDKKQIKQILEDMKKNTSKDLKFNDFYGRNYLERSFFSLSDNLLYNYKVKFIVKDSCIQCNNNINLLLVCQNFDKVKNDILWIKCKCGEYLIPKIKIRFGLDLLKNQSFKTYSTDEVVLHSPYNLKINIKNAVMSHYGTNIDILNFKSQFKPLFWDFIWYCTIHDLDYSIILPYLKDLESAKQINVVDPNREIFEVDYNDELYEQNVKKISNIAKNLISHSKQKEPFQNLTIKKEINFEFIKNINKKKEEKKEEKKEGKKEEEEDEEEEEEEDDDDIDDVDIDLNIPINKNILNAKRPEINNKIIKPGIQDSGVFDKLKLKKNDLDENKE